MKKIKWERVLVFILFLLTTGISLYDIYMITLRAWITGQYCGFTLLGLITFVVSVSVSISTFMILKDWWDEL